MYITKDISARMEGCIKQSHIEVTRQYSKGQILEINGGAACFSGFDSFLSQVVGWGFTTKPKNYTAEIAAIEQFYKSLRHSRVDIELCPFVGNDLAVFLSQRGYGITELNNVSAFDLKKSSVEDIQDQEFNIRAVKPDEMDLWAERVAAGFGYPEAEEQFYHYAHARGVTAFAAFEHDKIVAGATIAIHGDVCDLGVTSTIPAYRKRGLQKKLLCARLNFARQHDLEIATVTTEPGTISDLNIQKSGFHCAYTRIKMTRILE